MMLTTRKFSGLIVLIIVLSSAVGCKSKKKAMEASAAEKARIEQEQAEKNRKAAELEKEKALAASEKARLEAEEKLRKENEMKAANSPTNKLNQYFSAIAKAGNTTSANTSINEALTMFASPDTPVLIVISEEAGVKDYDRPTTIKDYLNYVKDQKKSINSISDMKTDSSGKITELELRKNWSTFY